MTYNIAILGASGYTGAELIRLISEHSLMSQRQGIWSQIDQAGPLLDRDAIHCKPRCPAPMAHSQSRHRDESGRYHPTVRR